MGNKVSHAGAEQQQQEASGASRLARLKRENSGKSRIKRQRSASGRVARDAKEAEVHAHGDAGGAHVAHAQVEPRLENRGSEKLGTRIQSVMSFGRSAKRRGTSTPAGAPASGVVAKTNEDKGEPAKIPVRISEERPREMPATAVNSAGAAPPVLAKRLASFADDIDLGQTESSAPADVQKPAHKAEQPVTQTVEAENQMHQPLVAQPPQGSLSPQSTGAAGISNISQSADREALATGEKGPLEVDRAKEHVEADGSMIDAPETAHEAPKVTAYERLQSLQGCTFTEVADHAMSAAASHVADESARPASSVVVLLAPGIGKNDHPESVFHAEQQSVEPQLALSAQIIQARSSLKHNSSEYIDHLTPLEVNESASEDGASTDAMATSLVSTGGENSLEASADQSEAVGIPDGVSKIVSGDNAHFDDVDATDEPDAPTQFGEQILRARNSLKHVDASARADFQLGDKAEAEIFQSREVTEMTGLSLAAPAEVSNVSNFSPRSPLAAARERDAALYASDLLEQQNVSGFRQDLSRARSLLHRAEADGFDEVEEENNFAPRESDSDNGTFKEELAHAREMLKATSPLGLRPKASRSVPAANFLQLPRSLNSAERTSKSFSELPKPRVSVEESAASAGDVGDVVDLFQSDLQRTLHSIQMLERHSSKTQLSTAKVDSDIQDGTIEHISSGSQAETFAFDDAVEIRDADSGIGDDVVNVETLGIDTFADAELVNASKVAIVSARKDGEFVWDARVEPLTREATREDYTIRIKPLEDHLFENARIFQLLEEAARAERCELDARNEFLNKKKVRAPLSHAPQCLV